VAWACINFLRAKIHTAGFKQTDWGYSSSPILSFRQSGDVPRRIGDWPAGHLDALDLEVHAAHPNSRLVDRGDLATHYRCPSAGYRLSALAPAQRAVAQRLSALARTASLPWHTGGSAFRENPTFGRHRPHSRPRPIADMCRSLARLHAASHGSPQHVIEFVELRGCSERRQPAHRASRALEPASLLAITSRSDRQAALAQRHVGRVHALAVDG
jgi:hypothetical protein